MPELIAGMIDVFADTPLTGNPLAVVQGGDELSDEQMRRIAGEFNQAETTFILHSARADRKLRSFTASGAEVFAAGHNALGAGDTPVLCAFCVGVRLLRHHFDTGHGRVSLHGNKAQQQLALSVGLKA
jgi:PhzF family phenazine biosynthesis protein